MSVVGIDLSLRGPSVVCLPTDWIPGTWDRELRYYSFASQVKKIVGQERVEFITRAIVDVIDSRDEVFIEEYAFGSANMMTGVVECGGVLKWRLWRHGVIPRSVIATHARKLMFGSLPKMKSEAIKAYIKERLCNMQAPFWNDPDACDAFLVANAAMHSLGRPCLRA